MTVQLFPQDRIRDNPYQPRRDYDEASLAELAADMAANGMIETPCGRLLPGGAVELAVGSRRRRAWLIAFRDQPMPVDVLDLSDRQMSDRAASENGQRDDLNDVEKAHDIQRRQKDFGLTLAEAARPYKLGESAASNLIRALRLPAPVQDLIRARQLPQRLARELLVVDRLDPKRTEKLAREAISAENGEELLDDRIDNLLRQKARPLDEHNVPWKLDWPKEPIVPAANLDGVSQIVACAGCPQRYSRGKYVSYCIAGNGCYDAKMELAVRIAGERHAKKTNIPLASEGEKTTIVYDGADHDADWQRENAIVRLMSKPTPELRLVPYRSKDPRDNHGRYGREQKLGSPWVALATNDKAATEQYLSAKAAERKEIEKENREDETDAERRKRIAREEKEQAERRAERSAFHRQKQDVLWLFEHTAPIVATQIVVTGPAFLEFVEGELTESRSVNGQYFVEVNAHADALEEQIEKAKGDEQLRLRRERIAYMVLTHAVMGGWGEKPEQVYRFGDVLESVDAICGEGDADEQFGIKLLRGWDQPPIHHTAFNCWHCGKFGSREGSLTKRELDEEGWVIAFEGADMGSKEAKVVDVCCPDCTQAAASKRDTPKAARRGAPSKSKKVKR